MKSAALCLLLLTSIPLMAGECGFSYNPTAQVTYVRAEGWDLPGIGDFSPQAKPPYGLPSLNPIPGVTNRVLAHDEYPYIAKWPAVDFVLNGEKKRMRTIQTQMTVVQREFDGKVFAYTYGLIPVSARRVNGKWVIDSMAGCIFDVTFIDDKGDGIFRILTPGKLTTDMIPDWVTRKKN
jgi:hypothetical protein